MLDLNPIILQQVVEKASHDAARHERWLVAIVELADNPYVCRNPNGHGLIIGSTSGAVYSANGTCQCRAFEFGQPCYHRAMSRIVRLHDESLERQQAAPPDWPQDLATGKPLDWYAAKRAVEVRPMGDRLAAARKATAELNELFA